MSVDLRWQQVTCRRCKRTYTCTPEDDFYGGHADCGDGACFSCLLTENGMDPERTPVMVLDADGQEMDPRDLSRREETP